MSQPMTIDPMQFQPGVHPQIPPTGYQMFNPYAAQHYLHPNEAANFQSQQLTPEMFQMYFQLQMNQHGAVPMKPTDPLPPASTLMQGSSEESLDSGNETISPPHSVPQQIHSSHQTPHVSPHFPPPTVQMQQTPEQDPNQHHHGNQQEIQNNLMLTQQPPQVSSYAINNLLSSTQSSPQEVQEQEEEERENPEVRRNTLPTSTVLNRKRRAPLTENVPPAVIPPNFTANYTPMMMQNFAAFMDPYMRKEFCQICGDCASGYHYGVLSCEGCKGFFRRSVNKQSNYTCQKGNACEVHRGLRTRCQACRYAKCIEMGMNKENVRVAKEEPKKLEEEVPQKRQLISDELKCLTEAFKLGMPVSAKLESQSDAVNAVKVFIMNVPNLRSLFPADPKSPDELVNSFIKGLLTIRAAFTFDPISFLANEKFNANVEELRKSIRNSVFNDNLMSLLTAIHIIRSVNGESSNSFTSYCSQLRYQFAQTHPFEEGIYDRVAMKVGPSLNQ